MNRLSPDELLAQLEAYASDKSESVTNALTRARLQKAAYKLSRRWEQPSAAIGRMLVTEPIGWMVVSIGCDMGLFTATADGPKTLDELATATHAERAFTGRIIRACQGLGILVEPSPGRFGLSQSFKLLGVAKCAASLPAMGAFLHPIYRSMPAFCKASGFSEPRDKGNTAMQLAFEAPGEEAFAILQRNPERMKNIGAFLSVWATDTGPIHDVFPVKERLVSGFTGGVFLVDVGGGLGQRTRQLRRAMPDLPGRFIVQDQQIFAQQAAEDGEGNEWQGLDFFKEQPVKGARAYYMRHILHDWQDAECLQILARTREAMTPGYSKLLIHELVMPEHGAPDPWSVSSDMDMMSHLAAKDRTEPEWRLLLSQAGFDTVTFFMPQVEGLEAAIEAVI